MTMAMLIGAALECFAANLCVLGGGEMDERRA